MDCLQFVISFIFFSSLAQTVTVNILISKCNVKKTASHHRHILRLPIFIKKVFKKMKTFFSRKKTFSSYFLIFPAFNFFWFFCKKILISWAEKRILRNNTIWYAFYCKFATFSDFGKIHVLFFEKPIYFKNPQILNVLS